MTIKLYPFQRDLIDRAIASMEGGRRRVCLQLPTGGGKTVMAGWIAQSAHAKGKRTLVLVHRRELQIQFYDTLQTAGLDLHTGFISSGRPTLSWLRHQIASVQTLVRRLDRNTFEPDLIFVDEAHHATAASYKKIIDNFPNSRVLGLTATPERLDGKPLAELFDDLVCGPSPRELIDDGFLAPYTARVAEGVKRPDGKLRGGEYRAEDLDKAASEKAIADVVDAIGRFASAKRCIVFSASCRASLELAAKLNALGGGRAVHVDGETKAVIRQQALRDFAEGRVQYLCNVDLISEGFDCPACDCVVMARPTASLTIFLQQVGRALRRQAGKEALLLDCAANIEVHGSPCAARAWSLAGKQGGVKVQSKTCGVCRKIYFKLTDGRCPNCGAPIAPDLAGGRNPRAGWEEQPMAFYLFDPEAAAPIMIKRGKAGKYDSRDVNLTARRAYREKGISGLRQLAEALGYKSGWAYQRQRLIDNSAAYHPRR